MSLVSELPHWESEGEFLACTRGEETAMSLRCRLQKLEQSYRVEEAAVTAVRRCGSCMRTPRSAGSRYHLHRARVVVEIRKLYPVFDPDF